MEYNYSFIKVDHKLLSITIIATFMRSVPLECDESCIEHETCDVKRSSAL